MLQQQKYAVWTHNPKVTHDVNGGEGSETQEMYEKMLNMPLSSGAGFRKDHATLIG